jgi:class 3 adenylate cyclase/tetratricopeptide (TPR) repeat protein
VTVRAQESAARAPRDAVQRLVPYVPLISLDWLTETPAKRHRQVEGTLVFADVSGFTQLTEQLTRKGKIGGEEMNDLLGECFTELLDVAYRYGGGVVKWGGDAVLLLFHGDGHTARACRAAHEMQRTMRTAGRLRTSSGPVTLRMSLGVHSGTFELFLVGDLHRELVIAGPAATTTVRMEALAEAGEIALSRDAAAELDPACLGETRGPAVLLARAPEAEEHPAPPVGDVSAIAFELLVPIDIREHLLADESEPEHRPLTTAFVHFGGLDEAMAQRGPAAVADDLEELLGSVQRIARLHGVTFFDTDAAENGGKILLIAGAPRSSGNDEERMLRAVGTIMAAGGPLPLRIGVNWGRTFVADFGPPYRRTYSVKGDAVNLAARLMARAEPGQILVAADVLDRSRARFDVEAVEPFRAKGKTEPVQAFVLGRPLGTAGVDRDLPPLVGREQELATLMGGLESLRLSSGSIFEVVGEPGLGKSRLLEELRSYASEIPALSVECDEYASSTAYGAVRSLLRDLLGMSGDESGAEVEAALRICVDSTAPHLASWIPLLGTVMGHDLADTPESAPLDEQFRRERLHEVTAELLGLLVAGPAMLVFEDAHWMDEASANLLAHVAGQLELRPWMVVTTRREQESGFHAPDGSGAVRIELRPLDAEQASALLHASSEESPLLPHEIEALAERSGGNPLFLTELLTAAREAGGVDALPDSVESLLMSQIDRLSPSDRRLLRSAAVIGQVFSADLLGEVIEATLSDPELDRLSDFVVDHDDGDRHFRFRHALVRDAAYEGLSFRRRRALHGSVGEAIERRVTGEAGDEAGVLSLHFFHAGDLDRAWRYSRVAGDRAKRVYANAEAADFYERALAASSHRSRDRVGATEVAAVSESLGDVRVRLGDFESAGEAYRSSRRQQPSDPVEAARLMLKQALVPWRLGRYPQALRWLTRAIGVLEGQSSTEAVRERARLYAWKGVIRQKQGHPKEAIEWCRRAIDDAEPSGADDALAQAYYILDWAYAALGRFDEAVYSPRALAIYEELGDLVRQGSILNNQGAIAFYRGRWSDSIDFYERAQEVWERAGDRWSAAFAVVNRAEVLLDQGRLDEAEPLMRSSLRIARASRSGSRIAEVLRYYGRLLGRSGRYGEARELLEEARSEFERAREHGEVLLTDARAAELLAFEGRAEEALSLTGTTLDRAKTVEGIFVLVPLLHRIRGISLVQLGRFDEARDSIVDSVVHARAESADYEVALGLDSLVTLGLLDGELAEEAERERDGIFGRLGVVSAPGIPLPVSAF